MPLDVTSAVRLPNTVGLTENVTVSEVAVADTTVPTALLLNVTELLAAVVAKPNPAMVICDELAAKPVVLMVTTGDTSATFTAVPLMTPLDVTIAVRLPALGLVPPTNVTDIEVVVRPVDSTVPTAPLLNVTVLLVLVVSKPKPEIVSVSAFAARSALLTVTTGRTVATLTNAKLSLPLVVTLAVKSPATVADVAVISTVNDVAVAAVTAPVTPFSNVTVLFTNVVSKPDPTIVIAKAVALAETLTEPAVKTGTTVATWTAAPPDTPSTVTSA